MVRVLGDMEPTRKSSGISCQHVKDIHANCFCASLLCMQFTLRCHATSYIGCTCCWRNAEIYYIKRVHLAPFHIFILGIASIFHRLTLCFLERIWQKWTFHVHIADFYITNLGVLTFDLGCVLWRECGETGFYTNTADFYITNSKMVLNIVIPSFKTRPRKLIIFLNQVLAYYKMKIKCTIFQIYSIVIL